MLTKAVNGYRIEVRQCVSSGPHWLNIVRESDEVEFPQRNRSYLDHDSAGDWVDF